MGSAATAGQRAHANAGDYASDVWLFGGNINYNPAGGVVSDSIARTDATISVSGYDLTYNGLAHTATGVATGVNGENLSSLLNLSGTTHTNAGTYASDVWTFAGNTNYNADSGTAADHIAKAQWH